MTVLNEPGFWDWLKEQESEKQNKDFEPIPLYISLDIPPNADRLENETPTSDNSTVDYIIDTTVDTVIFVL